jgi:signal transduction histidine kinase
MSADRNAPARRPARHRGADRRKRARLPQSALRGELVAFLALSLFALFGVAAATIVLSGRIARDNQLSDARSTAVRMADRLVEPTLAGAASWGPQLRGDLDRAVESRLRDGSVTVVLVWSADGRILYSSDAALNDLVLPPSPQLAAAIDGQVVSDVDENPELPGQRTDGGSLLEVYAPVTLNGLPLAFEAYFSAASIDRDAALLRGRIVPLAVGALAVLEVLQIPLVVSLGRRLSRHEADRTDLALRNLLASDRERREIAADVHDGPVQDLAGVSYALSAVRPSVPEAQRATVDRMITAVRSAVASLRRLMVQIYPPDLSGPGLGAALHDLAGPLRERGLTVHVQEDHKPGMSPSAASLLYRTAREALNNVTRHAQAQTVWIRLDETHCGGLPAVRLTVTDDGVGFPDAASAARSVDTAEPVVATSSGAGTSPDGHLGLRLVRDRVVEAGGALTVGNAADRGAVLEAVVPAQHGD